MSIGKDRFQKNKLLFLFLKFSFIVLFFISGCSAIRTTTDVVKTVGKAGWGTAKVTGKVLKTTSHVALETGKGVHKGTRTIVYMAKGKDIIALQRESNSLYANVILNRKTSARFLLDTGASSMQISRSMARRLGVDFSKAEKTIVGLAGGYRVEAYTVILKEVKLGSSRVKNVKAIVLNEDHLSLRDGLIGMSFLNHFDFQVNPQKPELILQQKAI